MEKSKGKTIIINERQYVDLIIEQSMADIYNPYSQKIKSSKEAINNLLSNYGKQMINIENGRVYMVYYAKGISDSIGKQYVICRVIDKNNRPFGSVYIKPLELFINKY